MAKLSDRLDGAESGLFVGVESLDLVTYSKLLDKGDGSLEAAGAVLKGGCFEGPGVAGHAGTPVENIQIGSFPPPHITRQLGRRTRGRRRELLIEVQVQRETVAAPIIGRTLEHAVSVAERLEGVFVPVPVPS